MEGYLGVDLLISERLEAAIFGESVDIQGSNLKGEKPVTSITLYSRHDTGAGMSGYIDMSVYISLGTSDAYPVDAGRSRGCGEGKRLLHSFTHVLRFLRQILKGREKFF